MPSHHPSLDRVPSAHSGLSAGPTTNALGQPVHHTEDGVRAFNTWFQGSRAIDGLGRPLVLFHGTYPWEKDGKSLGNVQQFDRLASVNIVGRRPSIDTVGSWFSTNPGKDGAELYGNAIYPVYLDIKNPHETTFSLMLRRARLLANGKDDGRQVGQLEVDALRAWLRAIGKDGIKIVHDPADSSTEFAGQDAWIALEPEQIKSAIGNDGSFRRGCPLITGRASVGPCPAAVAEPSEVPRADPVGQAPASNRGVSLEVFHGTRAKFDEFMPSDRGLFGPGIYLTSDLVDAEQYAGDDTPVVRAHLRLERPFHTHADYAAGEGHDIDSPAVGLVLDLFGSDAGEVLNALRDDPDGRLGAIVQERLLDLGHDGIVISWPDGLRHYVAFDSSQVTIQGPVTDAKPICPTVASLTC